MSARTETFTTDGIHWQAIIDGEMVDADFNSKGAAEAAIPIERARRAKRQHRTTPYFDEHDCGGVFDGNGVVSDADPGL